MKNAYTDHIKGLVDLFPAELRVKTPTMNCSLAGLRLCVTRVLPSPKSSRVDVTPSIHELIQTIQNMQTTSKPFPAMTAQTGFDARGCASFLFSIAMACKNDEPFVCFMLYKCLFLFCVALALYVGHLSHITLFPFESLHFLPSLIFHITCQLTQL